MTTAVGQGSQAIGFAATAYGQASFAQGNRATALGGSAQATGSFSTAVGFDAQAAGAAGTAVGQQSRANFVEATALGQNAQANAGGATAIGTGAIASAGNAMAIGRNSNAAHANATAIGFGAATTAANQIRLGTTDSIYSAPGLLTSSDAAQTGPEFFVTIDSNGTLGKGAQSSAAINQLGTQVSALQQEQAIIDDQVASLFDLRALDRKQWKRGIAAATAMANAPFPSEPGKTSYAANGATYRGEVAFSASISHRLAGDTPFAINVGVSHSGGKDTAIKAGIAGEF